MPRVPRTACRAASSGKSHHATLRVAKAGNRLIAVGVMCVVLGMAGGVVNNPATATEQAEQPSKAEAPDAAAALTQMRTFLLSQRDAAFRTWFQITTDIQGRDKRGTVHYIVRQPNLFRVELTIGKQVTLFLSDGKTLTIFRPSERKYTKLRAAETLMGSMYKASGMLALQVRVIDFLWTAEYFVTVGETVRVVDRGASRIGDRQCRHITVERMHDQWDVWLQTSGAPLPCKLVSHRSDDPARAVQTNEFTWTIDPVIPPDTFTFAPPAGSKEVSASELD